VHPLDLSDDRLAIVLEVLGLTLTIIIEGCRRRHHLTSLSRVHQRILALLDCSADIYTRLGANSHKPP